MKNLRISFEKLDGVTPDEAGKIKLMPGYEHIDIHTIFEIYIDGGFTRKARLVADSHTVAPPLFITYSNVVSMESVIISFWFFS